MELMVNLLSFLSFNSSDDIVPVYPNIEEHASPPSYTRIVSCLISTPEISYGFSIMAATVSSDTSFATVTERYF